jgi:uncharacterized protein YbbC (DUF1343 family)/CubicO group peptidase (beta-lactamase class C family)
VVRGLALAAILAVVLPTFSAVAAVPDLGAVDEQVRGVLASGDIPGAVVLVGRRDETLLFHAYGARAVLPERVAMTTDTIFDIASLTKPFATTLAVMALVEKGAVKLDAPLGRYLKEFASPPHREVTIRRILTHSAGLPAIPADNTLVQGFPRAARALASRPLDYPPGTSFEYSDTGFILLGEVVRRVSGQALDRYVEQRIYRPLGLRDTGFHPPAAKHPRIAPTELHNGVLLQGEVHDPRARLLGEVAGHAGVFSTAADLARICRMLLHGGVLDGRRVLRAATVREMWARAPDGNGARTLGWDMTSGYAITMALFFPPESVGHLGYTGTSVWIDPPSGTYLIVLTNRVHPSGGSAARIRELRQRVAAAAGAALFTGRAPGNVVVASPASEGGEPLVPPPAATGRVQSGLEVLAAQNFTPLRGQAVGLVTNQTGVDALGRRAIDLIAAAPGVTLQAIFSPEHGIEGDANADVAHGRDPVTGRPIWSLYGPTRRPTPEMLRDLSTIVFDIQDVGVRYYTYLATLTYVLEEAARRNLPVFVLDRPNPITGRVVEGPVMDPDLRSFTAAYTIPVRSGLTIGEFARLYAGERKLPVPLTVVPMVGWDRNFWYDETGLPWVNPSPNIRSVTQALLYSGIGLLEATNLSVGRGTDTPFEVVGAPWIEPVSLADALNRMELPGVRFEPTWFTPTTDVYARTTCGGVRIGVTDRDALRPVRVALALAVALRANHRDQFRPESVQNLLVNRSTMWAFLRGEPMERLSIWADADRSSFLNRRASYLMY